MVMACRLSAGSITPPEEVMTSGPGTMYINRLRLHLCICAQVLGSRRILLLEIRWEFDPPLVLSVLHLGTHSFVCTEQTLLSCSQGLAPNNGSPITLRSLGILSPRSRQF